MNGRRRIPVAALAVAGVVLAAGCGGGGKSPGVANLPPSHGGTTTQSAPTEAAPPAPSGQSHANAAIRVGPDGAKFAACVRKNGVPNFPDPNGQGVIQFGSGSGVDPSSPKFQAAMKACRKVLPNGGQPSPQQIAKAQQTALKFSACMRSHGLKDFPDPTFSAGGGGIQLKIGGRPGSDLNPSSPLFQKAQAACQSILPGKFGSGP
jgi:hypothetical protein